MENISRIAVKKLHDFFRPYKDDLGRIFGRKIFSFLKGMIEGRTIQMCEAGRFSEPKINPKTYCSKILETLGTIKILMDIHLEKLRKKKI